jgi:23S rRNA (cytidine1920-2'-O)/16S rRNA (cytidine1409-2'-O)-methyltransferase
VIAVDVGYGQLAWSLRSDPRVTALERTNVRDLGVDDLPYRAELVVADLSFISLRTVLPALLHLADEQASFVVLVKPQFEAGRAAVGEGGVVRDPSVWLRTLDDVTAAAAVLNLGARAVMASPLPGPSGNVEFLAYLEPGALQTADIAAAVAEGERIRA